MKAWPASGKKMKTYKEEVMEVTAKMFWRSWDEPLEKIVDKDVLKDKLWIVPITFCVLRYINSAWYFPADYYGNWAVEQTKREAMPVSVREFSIIAQTF